MYKKITLTYAIVILIGTFSIAQKSKLGKSSDLKIKWGEDFKMPRKHYSLGFAGNQESGYVNICYQPKKSILLQKFDNSLKLKGESTTSLKGVKMKKVWPYLSTVGTKSYWTEERYDKKADKQTLVYRLIDPNSGKLGPEKIIFENSKTYNIRKLSSFDKSTYLYSYKIVNKKASKKENFETYGFHVYDNELNKLWEKKVKMPYLRTELESQDFQVTSDGTVYMLVRKKADKKGKGSKETDKGGVAKTAYGVELFKISADEKQIKQIEVPLNPKFYYTSALIMENAKKEIVMVSLYSSSSKNKYDGIAAIRFNIASNNVTGNKEYEIPEEVLKAFESKKTNDKADKQKKKTGDKDDEAGDLELRNITFDSASGDMYVTTEQYRMVVVTRTNGKTTTTDYYYYYDDVYVFKVESDDKLAWVRKIPKAQWGRNTTLTMSVFPLIANGNYYSVYFDDPKNLNLAENKRPERYNVYEKGAQLVAAKIDEDGLVSKQKLYDLSDKERALDVRDFDRVGNGAYMTLGFKRRDQNAVLLTVEKD